MQAAAVLSAIVTASLSAPTAAQPALTACFTPGQDCTSLIVRTVDGAKSELLVQAYSFISPPIIAAIARAKTRGVRVGVILDRSNETGRYSGATYLMNHGIVPLIDYRPAIAHNKVMVIDKRITVTGSFNFTKAAQTRNAENVLVIEDAALAAAYRSNWQRRARASRTFQR